MSQPPKKTPPKKKPTGGRVTPKGTGSTSTRRPSPMAAETAEGHPEASRRYTPPVPQSEKISPPWVAPLMFVLLGIGILMIVLNYMGLLPGSTDNWYLLGGLGFILAGIVTATQLH